MHIDSTDGFVGVLVLLPENVGDFLDIHIVARVVHQRLISVAVVVRRQVSVLVVRVQLRRLDLQRDVVEVRAVRVPVVRQVDHHLLQRQPLSLPLRHDPHRPVLPFLHVRVVVQRLLFVHAVAVFQLRHQPEGAPLVERRRHRVGLRPAGEREARLRRQAELDGLQREAQAARVPRYTHHVPACRVCHIAAAVRRPPAVLRRHPAVVHEVEA